jgi:hypothetical protein
MFAFRRLPLAATAVALSATLPACERNPAGADADAVAPEEVRIDGAVQSVDVGRRSLTLVDGRVMRLDAAAPDPNKDPVILADRVLAAGGTVRVSGAGGALAPQPSAAAHGPLAPQASLFSSLVITFEYDIVDEVQAVEPFLGVYVLDSGIPLVIDQGVDIDPAGDFTSLEQVGVALALGQSVNSTSHFRVVYQVSPFDVDLFLETVRFDLL